MFTKHLLIGDAKDSCNQAALDIGICTVENFNKVLLEMTKHFQHMLSANKRGIYMGTELNLGA